LDLHIHPLLLSLPTFIHIKSDEGLAAPWLETTLQYLSAESFSDGEGAQAVINRLTDILFIQILRVYLQRLPDQDANWMQGIKDPQLSRALNLIHGRPDVSLSLDSLSRAAGMSRASFALKFKRLVGESPVHYLTRWRMYKASTYLKSSKISLCEVAQKVGYSNDAAFSKVFKRYLKKSPGQYRRVEGDG
jgi:transcriptional regulator GlxA family with amidase domain